MEAMKSLIYDRTPAQEHAWKEWVAARPPHIQALCEQFPPNRLYRMKSTGRRVTIYAYNEDKTVDVAITRQFNYHFFDRRVFGIDVEDLAECDVPAPDEPLGALLTEEPAIGEFIERTRPLVLAGRKRK